MENIMVMEFSNGEMEIYMKESGLMARNKAKESSYGQMDKKYTG